MSTRNNLSIMSTSEPGPLSGIEFYSFTYVVGKLAVQLLVPRWKHLLDSGKPLVSLNPNAFWADAEALFWPHPGGFISWPLPMYIGDDTIQKYIYRFNNPVTVTVVRGTQVFSNIAT
ncbi:MAG TPA: hypothetical protein VK722_19450 [Candidatus Aquilonibacter sp.]|nr:hypothetical protein [Candidatus Aquilonibacter sp.]